MSRNYNVSEIKRPLHIAIEHAFTTLEMKVKHGIKNPPIAYLMGTPGGGKTALSAQIAKEKNYNFLSFSPALERIEKFGGIPDIIPSKKDDVLNTVWSVPEFISKIRDLAEDNKPLMVLFDDWHLCPEEIQQIGFELFTYNKLNDHVLPDNVHFMLAGNETSAAGARVQLSAIRNRCITYRVVSDVDYWIDNFAIPNQISDIGIAFFSSKDNLMYFHEEESTSHQFGSPRSWTFAFQMLDAAKKNKLLLDSNGKLPIADVNAILHGCVSPSAASGFISYWKAFSSVDLKKIFEDGKIEIPSDNIEKFAFSFAMVSEVYNRMTTKNADHKKIGSIFGKTIQKLFDEKSEEIAIKSMRALYKKPKISNVESKNYIPKSGVDIIKEIFKTGTFKMSTIRQFKNSVGFLLQIDENDLKV